MFLWRIGLECNWFLWFFYHKDHKGKKHRVHKEEIYKTTLIACFLFVNSVQILVSSVVNFITGDVSLFAF